ncbi:hypothetical protein CY34DRAFT_102008, partial [Suillus luteus UH-Slu-Lm8-n1]
LHKLAYKLIHSTTLLLPVWHNILQDQCMSVTNMPRDVSTRWNLTYDMLWYTLAHQDAINIVTQRQDLGLRKFELADNEWEITWQLCDILKDATLFFSCSTPNLATVIPAMDLIDQRMTMYSRDMKFLLSIHSAIGLAKKTLDQYYQLTDKSEVYRIAMGKSPVY